MTKIRQALSLLFSIVLLSTHFNVLGQANPLLPLADQQSAKIEQIQNNPQITADAAFKLLSEWNSFPSLKITGKDFTWFYNDEVFGNVPIRVYIPGNYRSDKKSPCILMLHGAASRSRFADIDSLNKGDDLYDVFKSLMNEGYIIVRPIADRSKKFDWVVNKSGDQPNLTFKTLNNALNALKRVLNIDDNKIFAFGHSDGADGATGLSVYDPRAFAGIIAYNSMLTNIFARDFYIRNTFNRCFYVVHSDLDDLRPILQTRAIINALKSNGDRIFYKEYIGYTHQDKHLEIDRPRVVSFMHQTKRDAFRSEIWWETNSLVYNVCDWLAVTKLNGELPAADWYQPFNIRAFDKTTNTFSDRFYYGKVFPSNAIQATYTNNTFNIQTSRIAELEVKISPLMVDLRKPVSISVNGKEVYNGIVIADKQYLINSFKTNFDRQALWVNSIQIAVN